MSESSDSRSTGFISLLDSIGILALEGADAVPFIHRQLSNDIESLGNDKACLAAYCSPQGRVLALFTVWKQSGRVFLALPKDILPAIQKRLKIYVLRDKVTVSDVSAEFHVYGICGRNFIKPIVQDAEIPVALYEKIDNDIATVVKWPDSLNDERWLCFSRRILKLSENVDENQWWRADILAGMPRINLAVQNRYIPQMLNLEQIGGLSFTKGCYPGQEIVARSQYRGSVKSGLFIGHAVLTGGDFETELTGKPLFNSFGSECGSIILADISKGHVDFLAVARFEDASSGDVHLERGNGPAVELIRCE